MMSVVVKRLAGWGCWRAAVIAMTLVVWLIVVAGARAQASGNVAAAWGLNLSGEVGDGSEFGPEECLWLGRLLLPCSTIPVEVSGLSGVKALAGGEEHSLALLESGTVMAWGSDVSGQLGAGVLEEEAEESDVPVAVKGLSGATAVAAGGEHSLALLQNGTVKAWGGGESGEIGNRRAEDSDVPVLVNNLTGVVAIAAGEEDSLALLEDHLVRAWGYNGSGQLGDETKAIKKRPIWVSKLGGVVAVAAGEEHNLALLENGTVKAWGSNYSGQLGDDVAGGPENCGTKKSPEPCSDVPVAVSGLSGVAAVAAGGEHSLALLSNGTVMAWGANQSGQLGDGNTQDSDVPVAVSGLSGVVAIAAGEEDSLALLSNGTVMAWGSNELGQLGEGFSTGPENCGVAPREVPCSRTPVSVPGLSGIRGIAAGEDHDLAFGPTPPEAKPQTAVLGQRATTGSLAVPSDGRSASSRRCRRVMRARLKAARAARRGQAKVRVARRECLRVQGDEA